VFLRLDVVRECLGRACHRLEDLRREEFLAKYRIVEDACDFFVDLQDDVARGLRGCKQSKPGARLVAGNSALGHRGYVGRGCKALQAADPEDLHVSATDRRQRGADAERHQADMAANQVRERWRRAAIMHGLKLQPRHALEQHHVHVERGADPGGAISELARFLTCERNQLADVCRGERRVPEQRLMDAHEPGDRDEVLLLVVGKLAFAVERRVDHERAGLREQQRIAIGRGLGDRGSAEHMRCAALVLDDDLLAPALREPLPNRASDHVGHPARSGRDRDGDGAHRIGLRLRRGRGPDARQQDEREAFHFPLFAFAFSAYSASSASRGDMSSG
jgi:hypothetical protein